MKTIVVVSANGGVGKTTVTTNLASALWQKGREVLVVDMDPQGAVSFQLKLEAYTARGLAESILAGDSLEPVCVRSDVGMPVLPFGLISESQRHALEQQLHQCPGLLRQRLRELQLSDDAVIMIDTPPGPSAYLGQALMAADLALLVSLTDAASYATLPGIRNLIRTYENARGQPISYGFVLNQFDRARQLSDDVLCLLRAGLGDRVLGLIHQDQAVAEALAFQQSVRNYAPYAQATVDFGQCLERVEQMLSSNGATA